MRSEVLIQTVHHSQSHMRLVASLLKEESFISFEAWAKTRAGRKIECVEECGVESTRMRSRQDDPLLNTRDKEVQVELRLVADEDLETAE